MSTLTTIVGRVLRIGCPCDLAAVREAGRSIRSFLENQGLRDRELDAWELALAEAGNNAVEHALPEALTKPIEFVVEVSPAEVEVRVLDHTAGFDFPEAPKLPDAESESGRGLFLLSQLTDRVFYLRGRDENCMVMQRAREAGSAAGSSSTALEAGELDATLTTMTEELAASYESLAAIFRFTAEMNRSSVDHDFTGRWLRELSGITGADWYLLRLASVDLGRLETNLTSRSELLFEPLALAGLAGRSVEILAATGQQDCWFDAQNPLPPNDPLHQFGRTVAGLAHPIFVNSTLVGVLAIGRYTRDQAFNAGQVNIIHTFADFLGIQIRNARIQESHLQSRLLHRELEIAATIQRSLLPVRLPQLKGLEVTGFAESASKVGGDFYDAVEADHGVLLAIADVMGKGVPAAMFAAIVRSHIRARPDLWTRPGEFLRWLNQALFSDLDRVEMFVTAQVAFVDWQTGRLRVASAGHCPMLLSDGNGRVLDVSPDGQPLGIDAQNSFETCELDAPPGMLLAMFTDGLIEARDQSGRLLGLDPVRGALATAARAGSGASAAEMALLKLVRSIQGASPASDDLTLLIAAEAPGFSRVQTPAPLHVLKNPNRR